MNVQWNQMALEMVKVPPQWPVNQQQVGSVSSESKAVGKACCPVVTVHGSLATPVSISQIMSSRATSAPGPVRCSSPARHPGVRLPFQIHVGAPLRPLITCTVEVHVQMK